MPYENHHLRIRNSLFPLDMAYIAVRKEFEKLGRRELIDISELKSKKDSFQAALNGLVADCLILIQAEEENQ